MNQAAIDFQRGYNDYKNRIVTYGHSNDYRRGVHAAWAHEAGL